MKYLKIYYILKSQTKPEGLESFVVYFPKNQTKYVACASFSVYFQIGSCFPRLPSPSLTLPSLSLSRNPLSTSLEPSLDISLS